MGYRYTNVYNRFKKIYIKLKIDAPYNILKTI